MASPLPPERMEEIWADYRRVWAKPPASPVGESLRDLLAHIAYLEGEVSRSHVERCHEPFGIGGGVRLLRGACDLCIARYGPRQTPDPSEPGA